MGKNGTEKPETSEKKIVVKHTAEKKEETLIRRTPVGGRWWKGVEVSRHSMKYVKPSKLSKSWNRKVEERKKRKEVKALEIELKQMNKEKLEEEREKRKEKRKRKMNNELKNTKYQVIENTAKIKKMSKKQLRMIKKAKIDDDGNVEFVGIYK